MPRIPTHIQSSEASGSLQIQPNIGRRGGGQQALGSGLADVADVLNRVREQDAAADATLTLAKAQTEWQAHLLERQEAAEPGAPEFTSTLVKDYGDYVERTVATGKTRLAQQHLRERLTAFGGALSLDAMKFESEARLVDRSNKYTEAAELTATAAELDPDRYPVRLAEQLAALDQLEVSPIKRAELRKGTIDLVRSRAAIGYVRRDPDAALKRLTMPEDNDTLFRSLSPKARDAVLNEIESEQRMRLTREDRAYRDAERAEREVQDATSKEGDKLLAEGKLSAQWIESKRNRLSADDYRYYYRALSGDGSGPRNVELYANLRERAGRGENVRDEARAALTRGAIGTSDFDRIVGEVEGQRPGWYKRGLDFISTSAAVSDLNPDPAAAQRKAAMLDDWNDWADENQKASDTEARDAYKRIVEEYQIVDTRNFTLTKRAPRFLVGSRTAPDLDATEAATVAAFEDKAISEEEFERQALLLQEWRDALASQQKAPK